MRDILGGEPYCKSFADWIGQIRVWVSHLSTLTSTTSLFCGTECHTAPTGTATYTSLSPVAAYNGNVVQWAPRLAAPVLITYPSFLSSLQSAIFHIFSVKVEIFYRIQFQNEFYTRGLETRRKIWQLGISVCLPGIFFGGFWSSWA